MLHDGSLAIARTVADVRRIVTHWRLQGLSVGLVPTMGWLHAGHVALIDRAREQNDRVLATIFVNPLQFGPAEDFEAYPRDDARDFKILRERRCDVVFAPTVAEMFPDGRGSLEDTPTRVSVAGLSDVLCGQSRPGHFDGVATIVLKLLLIVLPDTAYFGEKDYQQLTIIARLVRDLNVPVNIAGVPIVREADGLALSSRNVYLDARQRQIAPCLARALVSMRERLAAGGRPDSVLAAGRIELLDAGFDRIDYVTLASAQTLVAGDTAGSPGRLFAAAWLGRTRLIDNVAVLASE